MTALIIYVLRLLSWKKKEKIKLSAKKKKMVKLSLNAKNNDG